MQDMFPWLTDKGKLRMSSGFTSAFAQQHRGGDDGSAAAAAAAAAAQAQAEQFAAWQAENARAEAARRKAIEDARIAQEAARKKAYDEAEAKRKADIVAGVAAQQASGSSGMLSSANPQAAAAKLQSVTNTSGKQPFKAAIETASRSGNAFYSNPSRLGGT